MSQRCKVHPEPSSEGQAVSTVAPSTEPDAAGGRHPEIYSGCSCLQPALCCAVRNDKVKTKHLRQMVLMVVSALIPIITLFIIALVLMVRSSVANAKFRLLQDKIGGSIRDAGRLVHRLQIERGTTALYITFKDSDELGKLQDIYEETDSAINEIAWVVDGFQKAPRYFDSKDAYMTHIAMLRETLGSTRGFNTTLSGIMGNYTNDIDVIMGWIWQNVKLFDSSSDFWSNLISYQLLLFAKEHTGRERAIGSTFYSRGGFPHNDVFIWFMEESIAGKRSFDLARKFSSILEEASIEIAKSQLTKTLKEMRDEIFKNSNIQPSLTNGDNWFGNMTVYIDDLQTLQARLGKSITDELQANLQGGIYSVVLCALLLSLVLIIGPLILRGIIRQTEQIQNVGDSLHHKTLELKEEKSKSDILLFQMLPRTVAEQLKTTGHTSAETYDEVTVFFSDVVNFTLISAMSTPIQVIDMLNTLYQYLDALIDRYDVYKVETIGDAYMVVSGAPQRNGRRHAPEMAKLALHIYHNISELLVPHLPQHTFQLRIGIHTGPCAAGVAGSKRPRYCLFGDTINTASRMESMGQPGRIHISQMTQDALLRYLDEEGLPNDEFHITLRGTINVKGKGEMTTYWLSSARTESQNSRFIEEVGD